MRPSALRDDLIRATGVRGQFDYTDTNENNHDSQSIMPCPAGQPRGERMARDESSETKEADDSQVIQSLEAVDIAFRLGQDR